MKPSTMLERLRSSDRLKTNRSNLSKRSRIKALSLFVLAIGLLAMPVLVSAQLTTADVGLQFGSATGLATTDVRTMIANIINAAFGLMGLVVVGIFIYAGFLYMTAGGDASKVDTAKKWMTNAVIGLVIILSSYAIAAFIISAITGRSLLGGGPVEPETTELEGLVNSSSQYLGNGIIEYHYPEPGQVDVPRNTMISIVFKRPLKLSTVLKDYNDHDTYDVADDTYVSTNDSILDPATGSPRRPLTLNTDNFKIIPNASLGEITGATADAQFNARYPDSGALVSPAPAAFVTAVATVFSPADTQTLTIIPPVLGSAAMDMTYRVAIRGGDNGVKVWTPGRVATAPTLKNAFEIARPDGGYYWIFTTGTTVDTTPPTITFVSPEVPPLAGSGPLPRNEILQIYFSEPMDPTTTSGVLGVGGGFTNIEIQAQSCTDAGSCSGDYTTIAGQIKLGNRLRTAEFIPSTPCDGIATNSCGEPVYCLPRNVALRIRALAADLSTEPPRASASNGVLDMARNSLDGNGNGTADGPHPASNYVLNTRTGTGDTAEWTYRVGSDVDLSPPIILDIDPNSIGPGGTPPTIDTDYAHGGPSRVPVDQPISILWNKTLMVSSVLSGAYNETPDEDTVGVFTDPRADVALRSSEIRKSDSAHLDPPWFIIGNSLATITDPASGHSVRATQMTIGHRPFVTADQLGYSEADLAENPDVIPLYQPVIGAKIKDTHQNCFYPSEVFGCGTSTTRSSCCNMTSASTFSCSLLGS